MSIGQGFALPRLYPNKGQADRVTELHAAVATTAPRVPWDKFYAGLQWEQGEHVALIGPTGSGKTSLLVRLLAKRTYVAVAATKPRDSTMDYLIASGFERFDKWESISPKRSPKRVIWPDARQIDAEETQREVFRAMYKAIYREGGWALVIDEGFIMADTLGLKREMRTVWTQGRSLGISQVVATQRPAWVPREMYDQSRHLFFWQNQDERSLETLGDIVGRNPRLVRAIIGRLDKYQVLYVNPRTGQMIRTTPPPPSFDTSKD